MIKITVITPTCRTRDTQFQIDSLKLQTFKDFEWILVDDFHAHRKDKLAQLVGNAFPFIHIPPREIVPYFAFSMAMNTGLLYAKGELVFLMSDYILPSYNCLQRHWEVYQKYPKAIISGGLHERHYDHSGHVTEIELPREKVRHWWAGRNDSAPLEAILDCNGFEEDLDGERNMQDADLAERLTTYGLQYIFDTVSYCYFIKHSEGSKETEEFTTEVQKQPAKWELIIEPKMKEKIYLSNNPFNLREERAKTL